MFFEKFQRPSIRILPNWSFEAVAGPGVNLHFVRDPLLFQNSLQMVSLLHPNRRVSFAVQDQHRHSRRMKNFISFGNPPKNSTTARTRESMAAFESERYAPREKPNNPIRSGSTCGWRATKLSESQSVFIHNGKCRKIVSRSAWLVPVRSK